MYDWKQYKKIYFIAAIVFAIAAYFSEGFHHYDEHHQVMEFGGMKLGITEKSELPWEYDSQMRPAIQPMMVYVAHKVFGLVSIDSPFSIAFILRLFTGMLSFFSIHLLIKAFIDKIKGEKLKMSFVLLSFFLWFTVYNGIRFSSENVAGRVFVIAFALLFIWKNLNIKHYLAIGLLLGLSFLFRYQNAFLIVGFVAWIFFIQKSKFSNVLVLVSGIVLMFGVGVLIDRWFYEEWVLSTWKYFEENILLGKAASFGVDPWYFYFVEIFKTGIAPFSLLYIIPFVLLVIFRRKDVLVWTVLPFLLVHLYISHKEVRFLFPVIGFIPLMIVQSGEIINEKWQGFFQSKVVKVFIVLFWIYNYLFLAIAALKPSDAQVSLYQKVYDDYPQPTKLYCVKGNPYSRAVDVHYYKRKNMTIHIIQSLDEITLSKDSTTLFVTTDKQEQKAVENGNDLVYSSFPEWIKYFNVTNWVARTNFRKMYEMKRLPQSTNQGK